MKKPGKSSDTQRTEQSPPPGWCIVLEGYLAGWAPAASYSESVTLKTSQEIADDLADMAEAPIDGISSAMAQLGFRPHFIPYGAHGWMMRPEPSAIHTIRPLSSED